MVRFVNNFDVGIRRAIALALANSEIFEQPAFWKRVATELSTDTRDIVVGWAKEGLEKIDVSNRWGYAYLDLGDCPEIFRLCQPENQEQRDEQQFRNLLLSEKVITGSDICSKEWEELVDHSVSDLRWDDPLNWSSEADYTSETGYDAAPDDDPLSWLEQSEEDFDWNSGYFLWLACGSLALLEPLRELTYCKKVLGSCERFYLFCGFEEIFLYLATVTPEGLRFEGAARCPNLLQEWSVEQKKRQMELDRLQMERDKLQMKLEFD